MNLLIAADGHYYKDKNGAVYVDAVFDYSFYKRYLSVFENVFALARLEEVDCPPKGCKLASGEGVTFLPLPSSRGVNGSIKTIFKTKKAIHHYIEEFDCAIFRVPGVVGNLASEEYKKHKNKKFAIEVVVDPWEYFSKGKITGLARPIVRLLWTIQLKKICMDADGVSYVTENYLQSKYPCKALLGQSKYFYSSYSSVELPDNMYAEPRNYSLKDKWIIGHVAASFTGYGKGQTVLMEAVKIIREKGYNVNIRFIGDGPLRKEFETYAKSLNIQDAVSFLGSFPNGNEVRRELRKCDLFVFPTKAEGLPRCVLEAMAEGLPVISSPVCGIPEIISNDYLVDYRRPDLYADKIISIINNPSILTQMSKDNINTAIKFKSSILTEKRNAFYKQLKDYKRV